jgi:hypothetical protein
MSDVGRPTLKAFASLTLDPRSGSGMTWCGGVILNLIEDPFTSGFESLCYASELCHTSGVDTKGIRCRSHWIPDRGRG